MPISQGGVVHHISKKKRGSGKYIHKYPAESDFVRWYDKLMIIVALVHPLVTIPQVFKVYAFKTASGLSIWSWAGYFIFTIPWLIYGLIHKEKPLIITYILLFLLNLSVLVGILIYG